jgi:hypothetical protein
MSRLSLTELWWSTVPDQSAPPPAEAGTVHIPIIIIHFPTHRLTTAVRTRNKKDNMAALPTSLFRWVVPAAIGASILQSSLYDVKGGTRAVIFDRVSGVKEDVVNEGTHFLIPWLQRAIVYDVRTRPRNISTTTGSKDLQMVTLTLRVLHRPEVKQLPKIYQVRLTYPQHSAAAHCCMLLVGMHIN